MTNIHIIACAITNLDYDHDGSKSKYISIRDESDFMRIEYFHHTSWILLNPFIFLAFQLITFHLVEADHAWLEKVVRHRGSGLYAISSSS